MEDFKLNGLQSRDLIKTMDIYRKEDAQKCWTLINQKELKMSEATDWNT